MKKELFIVVINNNGGSIMCCLIFIIIGITYLKYYYNKEFEVIIKFSTILFVAVLIMNIFKDNNIFNRMSYAIIATMFFIKIFDCIVYKRSMTNEIIKMILVLLVLFCIYSAVDGVVKVFQDCKLFYNLDMNQHEQYTVYFIVANFILYILILIITRIIKYSGIAIKNSIKNIESKELIYYIISQNLISRAIKIGHIIYLIVMQITFVLVSSFIDKEGLISNNTLYKLLNIKVEAYNNLDLSNAIIVSVVLTAELMLLGFENILSFEDKSLNNDVNNNKRRKNKVNKQQFKKAIKATTIALAVSMVGMTSVACYTTPETKTNINQIDPNYQEKINIGDKRNYKESIENYDYKLKKGLVNVYGQEMTLDSSGNVIDWTNKRTDINETNHGISADGIKGGSHVAYTANIGDEKTWEIGPFGWPMPPEEFKYREKVTIKSGATIDEEDKAFVNRVQRGWTVDYVVNGVRYSVAGSDINGGRSIYLQDGTKTGKEILVVSSNDKSTNEQILALAIGNAAWTKAIKGQAKIRDSLGTK